MRAAFLKRIWFLLFTALMIHHAWLPSLCATVKHGQRLMSSFEFVLFLSFFRALRWLWLTCCRSMLHNVQEQSSSSTAARLPHTHECTHASVAQHAHTNAHISPNTDLDLDAHMWRQLTRAESVLRSSSILYSTMHRCGAALRVCFFSLISFAKVRFWTLLFSPASDFFPCGVWGGRKRREW